ncbi:MAG TPA: DeoR family transcriptional regulator, partial [Dongiaceae bacterium]|nr:DeoR family transcriptional regulator [Dongiaceae bacterium]
VSVLGGKLRSENASFVGPQAEAMLESLWFDQLFLGASAVAPDGAIYSVDSAEASLNKRMLARAAQSFVLADSSKFSTMATYRVAPVSTARVITDSSLSAEWRGRLAELKVDATFIEPGVQR